MKQITKNMVEQLRVVHPENYLQNHSLKDTLDYYNVTRKAMSIYLSEINIKIGRGSSNNKTFNDKLNQKLSNINIEDFIKYYNLHSDNQTLKEFELTKGLLKEFLQINNIQKHTKSENIRLYNLSVYGVNNVSQLESSKNKSKNTKIKKYNNPVYVNPEKAKQTNLNKYGCQCTAQAKEIKQKIEQTNLERYGNKYYFASNDGIEKCQQSKRNNYWKEESNNYTEEFNQLRFNKEESIKFLSNNYLSRLELAKRFNCNSVVPVQKWVEDLELFKYLKPGDCKWRKGGISDFECDVLHFIQSIYSLPIVTNNRSILKGKEIDIYLPDKNIGIECNGTYWHSDLYKEKKYHEEKSKLAESLGIRLIHIYEHEWYLYREKIESLLKIAVGKTDTKIYARDCEIKQIDNKEAKQFNELNHIQGHRNALITYGLYYNNNLVQLMSFSKHPKYEWEIIRGCPASNNIVVGGVSKLFKHFLKEVNPEKVFSYCDFNKFDGHGYESLGMRFIGYTGPDKKWIMPDGSIINRNPHKHSEYSKESEAILWGAGSKKFLYEK